MDRNRYKELLIQTMKAFINFCKDNDIKYVAAYGTVLGAVRHQGLIPWDDDIDVYMTRPQYEKFLSLRKKLEKTDYEISDISDEGYYLEFAKFCDRHTSIWEYREHPHIIGVFIDIFPVDEITPGLKEDILFKEKYTRCFYRYIRTYKELGKGDFHYYLKKEGLGFVKSLLESKYYYKPMRQRILHRLHEMEARLRQHQGTHYSDYCCSSYFLKKEWIEETIETPFEDMSIVIPKAWHDYLAQEYGNYMQFPPLDQRNSGHVQYFCDLQKRVTIQEARERIDHSRQ